MSGRVLYWVQLDPLWDGTPVWYLQDVRQPGIFETLMRRISPTHAMNKKVRWLEDDFFPEAVRETMASWEPPKS